MTKWLVQADSASRTIRAGKSRRTVVRYATVHSNDPAGMPACLPRIPANDVRFVCAVVFTMRRGVPDGP